MNVEQAKRQFDVGIVEPEYLDFLKFQFISEVFEANSVKKTNALVAYAGFLNHWKINSDSYPLYLKVLDSNNATAIDVLLDGSEPASYLDCVVANRFIINNFFKILDQHKRNEVYSKTLQVIVGFFYKVYVSPPEGYQLYKITIADINSLGKYLDEKKDQDDPLNRLILDVLLFISKLDMPHEGDQEKLAVARQASRIRSDFFDNTRTLLESMTDVTLQAVENPTFGLRPEYVYGRRPE